MSQRGLKGSQLKKVSSPKLVFENRASKPAVDVLAASTDLVGVDGTGSNAAPLAGTETRLDALEAKVNELIAALKK